MPSFIQNKDAKYIHKNSQKTLDFMSQYKVIPSPPNYQIWYNYATEENMSLNKAIDDIIRKGRPFTNSICENLYQKFFSNELENSAVTNAGNGIQDELVRIAKILGDVNKGTSEFNTSLGENLQNIANIQGGSELKAVISSLLAETLKITENNKFAQKKLKESTRTVQKLQMTVETIRLESMTDALTGIGNRKAFDEGLNQAINKISNSEDDLCLIMGDIDYFKKFNDHWGHHVGDQVLKVVAHTMKTSIGETGMVARYGGEEFVIILPGTSLDSAFEITDNIRVAISERSMKRKSTGESIGKITCSFGIAKYQLSEEKIDFLERADNALYTSKSNGRNKVSLEGEARTKVVNIA